MGWGIQKGGTLVGLALTRFAASRTAERSSILKEQRKYAEEMRLQKLGSGKGGGKGNAGVNKDKDSTRPKGVGRRSERDEQGPRRGRPSPPGGRRDGRTWG